MIEDRILKEILAQNRHIDETEVNKIRQILSKMGEATKPRYRLVSPYARRRVLIKEDERSDPRTIHL